MDKEKLYMILRLFSFFTAMIALVMAFYALSDAGLFCKDYCKCKYSTEEFSYRLGSCSCSSKSKSFVPNFTFNDTV